MTDRPRNRHLAVAPPPGGPSDGDGTTLPPHDHDAERDVLAGILHTPTTLDQVTLTLTAEDFHHPAHELIYHAILTLYARARPIDITTVANQLGTDLPRIGGRSTLEQLHYRGLGIADPAWHADIVRDKADRRRLDTIGDRFKELARTGDATGAQLLDTAAGELEAIPRGVPGVEPHIAGQPIDEFLAGDDPEYDWLVPGLLERQDRLIVTAGEGKGKSTLCRQIGIQTAAGIHPFTGERIPPITALILDLENSRRQSRRKLRPLRIQAGRELDPARLIIECRTGGIDLTQPDDKAWLRSLIREHRPDLLITGPIYKMASGDTDKEKDSKPVALALDALRDEFDLAVILEAHTRKADTSDPRKRSKEPYGWSGWMRWPEFGIHLSDDGEITHWRGARDEREWPHGLTRGGTWPWSASMTIANQNWVRIRQAIRDAGRKLDAGELVDATGLSRATVYRVLGEHSADLAQLYFDLEMDV